MRYLLAILLPPIAVLLCGRPLMALLNLLLTLLGYIPGMVHALFIVHSHIEDKRAESIIDAVKESKS